MIKAIKFPDMLNINGQTQLVEGKSATEQNLRYLLLSTKKTLLGDPYFGVNLRNMIYERNNSIIRDLIVDDIITNINQYMPQIYVQRKNIEVITDLYTVYVTITAQNIIDFNFETYTIKLLEVEEL